MSELESVTESHAKINIRNLVVKKQKGEWFLGLNLGCQTGEYLCLPVEQL